MLLIRNIYNEFKNLSLSKITPSPLQNYRRTVGSTKICYTLQFSFLCLTHNTIFLGIINFFLIFWCIYYIANRVSFDTSTQKKKNPYRGGQDVGLSSSGMVLFNLLEVRSLGVSFKECVVNEEARKGAIGCSNVVMLEPIPRYSEHAPAMLPSPPLRYPLETDLVSKKKSFLMRKFTLGHGMDFLSISEPNRLQ